MTWQTLLSIIGASAGLASALWFCAGAVMMTVPRIYKAMDQSWKADPGIGEALVSQSAEHLAGALLLLVAFGLQIAAAVAPPTIVPMPSQAPAGAVALAAVVSLAALATAGLLGLPLYAWRKRYLKSRLGI